MDAWLRTQFGEDYRTRDDLPSRLGVAKTLAKMLAEKLRQEPVGEDGKSSASTSQLAMLLKKTLEQESVWGGGEFSSPCDLPDVLAYEALQHFQRVNQLTLAQVREYLGRVKLLQEERDRVMQWKVDYGEWHGAVGLSFGEFYVPNEAE